MQYVAYSNQALLENIIFNYSISAKWRLVRFSKLQRYPYTLHLLRQ